MTRCPRPAGADASSGTSARLAVANLVNLFLDANAIQRPQRQAAENLDAAFERPKDFVEYGEALRLSAFCSRGILHPPMRCDRLPRPHRAGLACGFVADGEYEIELRRARPRELIPALAAQPVRRELEV